MNLSHPICVFDSGVGGLSVLREIRKALPGENLVYVADSHHAPYGDKSERFIAERSVAITRFLVSQNAKAIVVACNTATAVAAAQLRSCFTLPIVAIEPAIKPAAERTKSGVIGVLATQRTLASENFAKLAARFSSHVKIVAQPCPGLVEQIEAGDLDGANTRALVEKYLEPLLRQKADTLVLGCTHYPFLTPLFEKAVGPQVTILNPGAAVARELKRRLESLGLLEKNSAQGNEKFWTSGSPEKAQAIISHLWKRPVAVSEIPEPFRSGVSTPD